jgi:hypothetical protein
MVGEFGWLVTDVYIAPQLARPAMPSRTAEGSAARMRNHGRRRQGSSATTAGTASSTSGWTHTAAPVSQPARTGRSSDSASTAYSSSPTATASSGCPHRAETLHSAHASATASKPRFHSETPSRSARASAANSTTQHSAIW